MIALRALQLYRNSPIERYREEIVQREYTEKIFHHQQMSNDASRRTFSSAIHNNRTQKQHKSYRSLCIFVSLSSSVLLGDDDERET